jgi:hypothetical protein
MEKGRHGGETWDVPGGEACLTWLWVLGKAETTLEPVVWKDVRWSELPEDCW